MNAIQIEKLTKTYQNGTVALNEMSLEVRQVEVFTLLGPNGAGKSTLINILTTYLRPTAGEVRILGKDLASLRPFAAPYAVWRKGSPTGI